MIDIIRVLLGGKPITLGTSEDTPARQIFRAINNNHTRIEVLKTLLQKARVNKDKGVVYDEIISGFKSLFRLKIG
jgi:hypothetical protein